METLNATAEKANIIAARICNALIPLIDSEVEHYRTDIDHDVTAIENATAEYGSDVSFIHVSRIMGTNMYVYPHNIENNEPVKYLFGHKRPIDIIDAYAGCLSNCHEDAVAFRYWNGKHWKTVTRLRAIQLSEILTGKARANYRKHLVTPV